MNTYYVLKSYTMFFVKEGTFFVSQGGLTEDWGKDWKPIQAENIEDARLRAKTDARFQ